MGNAPQRVDTLAIAQQFQDRLIARRLPTWLTQVHDHHYPDLVEALHDGLMCRQCLMALWSKVEKVDDFVRRRLQATMRERHGDALDIDALYFRQQYFYISHRQSPWAGRYPLQDTDHYDVPLLSAALRNFTAFQASPEVQPKHNALVDEPGNLVAQPSAQAFAKLCRELDLGARYQQHLDSILKAPAHNGWDFKKSVARQQRSSLLLDALKAWTQGVLTWPELEMVVRLYRHGKPGGLAGAPVIARRLSVLGCDLQQIVVLDVIEEHWLRNTSKRVLVHIPGDPHGPWSAARNITAFVKDTLAKRLEQIEYRRFFARFVRLRDSQRFFSTVSDRLKSTTDLKIRGLDEGMAACPAPLFEHLAQARIAQIKSDAAMIATPVAQLDRARQESHDALLEAQGRTLLEVAGRYVPEIGALLHVAHAWSLLKEVFQAIEGWRSGDTSAALDHLMHVVEEVSLNGGLPEEFEAFRSTWERAGVVDQLVPALLEDGSEKLWNQDLAPFRSEPPPAEAALDECGLYRLEHRNWIEMDGHFYEVTKRDEDTWHLPTRDHHAPELVHNGAGAWRLWSEQPAQWSDTRRMFRRLGGAFSHLRDAQIDQVLNLYGMNDSHLRGLHVYGRAPEAELVDTVNRVWLANRVQDLVERLRSGRTVVDLALLAQARGLVPEGAEDDQVLAEAIWARRRRVFQHLYDEQNPMTDDTRALRRDFASLHRPAAEQLLLAASDDDLQRMRETGRVPLHLARLARVRTLRIRGARVFEALCIDTPQGLDLAQVVLRMLERLPGAVAGPRWALFEGEGFAPLLTTAGDGELHRLVHLDGQFVLRDGQGADMGAPGELFQTLADTFDERQRADLALAGDASFAQALRHRLLQEVMSHRHEVQRALGWHEPVGAFLAPLQISDGRVGYPLSGGWFRLGARRPRALEVRIHRLYPAFDDEDVANWMQTVQQAGRSPEAVLDELDTQYRALRRRLKIWQLTALGADERRCRRLVRKDLIGFWRCLTLVQVRGQGGHPYTLSIVGARFRPLTSLPSLPSDVVFDQVSTLTMRGLGLETVPDGFLRAFPNLRDLEITHCKLRALPLHPVFAGQLQILDLLGNDISLDEDQVRRVERCRSLVYLNLSENPLYVAPSVIDMPALNTLKLRDAQLWSMPEGVEHSLSLFNFDIRRNALRYIPAGFMYSSVWRNGRVRLDEFEGLDPAPQQRAWNERRESRVPQHLRWLDFVDPVDRDDMAQVWINLRTVPEAGGFFQLVASLEQSAGFSTDVGARDLANRMYRMMSAMLDNPEIRQALCDNAAITGCDDNATLRFLDLEVRIRVWGILQGDEGADSEQALLGFAGQLWRLARLDRFALNHALSMENQGQESVEVVLAYRIALNDVLDLCLNDTSMRYAYSAGITLDDIERARDAVANEQTESALVVWIAEREFWQRYLAQQYEPQFQVPQSHYDELERLEDEGGIQGDMERLQAREVQRVLELRLKLTREALVWGGANWKVPVIFDTPP